MRTVGLFLITLFCAGCAVAPQAQRASSSPAPYALQEYQSPQSLFSGDAAVLSDADIDRILKFSYVLPKQARVAVLSLGQELWFGYSDELARGGEEIRGRFTAQLKAAPTVTTASYLPSLLIPKNRSVAYFREAAARYQADLLVVYQSSCRTYEKYRLFSASSSKSFCNIEALVLDVRTGIVPFTTVATQEFVASQSDADANFGETMRKAELSAIRDALGKIGNDIAVYLGKR